MKTTITLPLHEIRCTLFIIFLVGSTGLLQAQTLRFVKPSASGTGNGSSWNNASDDLQLMINNSASGDSIFVAAGTYIPIRLSTNTSSMAVNNRLNAFVLKTGVKIYGGFAGTESSVAQRILQTTSASVLSGDLGNANDSTDNCYHMVIASGPAGIALLDGFTITGGNAGTAGGTYMVNGNTINASYGGGLYCVNSAPLIRNCTIERNSAERGGGAYNTNSVSATYVNCNFSYNNSRTSGGGMYNLNAAPTVTNCTFYSNSTDGFRKQFYDGGGMYNSGSSLTITDCTFNSNIGGTRGGGMYTASSTVVISNSHFSNNSVQIHGAGISNFSGSSMSVTDCMFTNNVASDPFSVGGGIANGNNTSFNLTRCVFTRNKANDAGGLSNAGNAVVESCRFEGNEGGRYGGGVYNLGIFNNPTPYAISFTNCIFSGNKSMFGGAIYNMYTVAPVITNCSLSGNTDSNNGNYGGGLYNDGASPVLTNCIIWGNNSGIVNWNAAAPAVSYSIVQGGYAGTGNSNADPLFMNAPSYTGAPFTGGDYNLQSCSPAVNAGNLAIPSALTDLVAAPRVQAGRVDMGAYETAFDMATAGIVMAQTVVTAFQSNTAGTLYATHCHKLAAAVTGNGTATSVQGNTTVKVWMETVQPVSFVKRHFEITPQAVDPATATGIITLYFTQAEFDDFNAVNGIKLPTGPSDLAGILSLRIERKSGTSSGNTGLPGTYTGPAVTINPNDGDIIWNAAAQRWEVTFPVSGFGGLFVKTSDIPLPLRLLSFRAKEEDCAATIQWTTIHEVDVLHFDIQQSIDGIAYNSITTIPAKNVAGEHRYAVTIPVTSDHVYYQLKMVDLDGSTTFSKVAAVRASCVQKVVVSPNPGPGMYRLRYTLNSHASIQLNVLDQTGRLIQAGAATSRLAGTYTETVNINGCAKGVYMIELLVNGRKQIFKVIRQ